MAGFSARLVKKQLDLTQEKMLSAKMETKRQIAHNIHDSTARELSRIILTCRLIKNECLEEETPLTLEHLDLIESEATSTLNNTRQLISFLEDELDPAHKEVGLEELLSKQTKTWGKKQKLVLASVNEADLSLLSPSSKKLITDLILEILANAEKYAKPNSTVKLEITNKKNKLQISSLNLVAKHQSTESVLSGKTGLKNLKDRFSKLNGDLEYSQVKDSWQLQAYLTCPNSPGRK